LIVALIYIMYISILLYIITIIYLYFVIIPKEVKNNFLKYGLIVGLFVLIILMLVFLITL